MNPFNFTVQGSPLSWNATNKYKVKEKIVGKKKIHYVDSYPSPEGIKYKNKIAGSIRVAKKKWEAENGRWNKENTKEGVWVVRVNYVLHRRDIDPTNVQKMLIDGIVQAGLLNDDCNVVMEKGILVYCTENPRVYVSVYKSEQTGIWPTEAHKQKWISDNCADCKKGNRCAQFTKFNKGTFTGMNEGWICGSKINKQ